MGGEGSIQPLLNNNKNLLRKKSFFKRDKSVSKKKQELLKSNKGELQFKKISDKELLDVKTKIQQKAKKTDKRNGFYAGVALLFFISFMTYSISNAIKKDQEYALQTEIL